MIRRLFRTVRRSPGRILTSVFALALAVAAIGVFAIPTVATSSLRDAAERDGVANVVAGTTDTGAVPVADLLSTVDNVDHVEPQIVIEAPLVDGGAVTVVGLDLGRQQIDIVRATSGELPDRPSEAIVAEGSAAIGDVVDVIGVDGDVASFEVVGLGGTSFFVDSDVLFTTLDGARDVSALTGINRVAMSTVDTDSASLSATVDDVRTALAAEGIALTHLPETIPDGIHPVEAEIEQISMLIGLLGIVAGLVGLVLLASTTNTLVIERTREVAIMRALGSPPRALRRRLRRLALGIAAAAVVLGVPLGVVLSNVIARLVLQEFVGLTPGIAVSVPVMVASAAFALVGARLVAARAARRVTKLPLATALRDRNGSPFGRRASERIAARVPLGGLLSRSALRNGVQRRARSLAIATQIGAAVAALMIVSSMATTITDFNDAELEPWRWSTVTSVAGPGLDIDPRVVDGDPTSEPGIVVGASAFDWEIDVFGFVADTEMIDRDVRSGRWFEAADEAVVSAGFAEHLDLELGDEIDVLLASGTHRYEISGLHPNRGREIYVDIDELASDLGGPGLVNRIYSSAPGGASELPDLGLGGVVEVTHFDELTADDTGRNAVLLIFGAIGLVVVSVAGLAVASGLAVSLYERRHEFAALQAIGGRRRHVFRLVMAELGALLVGGLAIGLVGGYFGGRAIARSFEVSNAVEIGFTFARGVIPVVVAVVAIGSMLLALTMVRTATRRPVALTLRGSA
jgi:ABC-type antimicrobial peptide transport system permease subunit